MTWHIVTLLVLAGVLVWAVERYHQRRQRHTEEGQWEELGFRKVKAMAHHIVWVCPFCGVPLYTRKLVRLHQDPVTSACAAHMLTAYEEEPVPLEPRWEAHQVVEAGGVDTMTEDNQGGWDMSWGFKRSRGVGFGAPMSGRVSGRWWREVRNQHARTGFGARRPPTVRGPWSVKSPKKW